MRTNTNNKNANVSLYKIYDLFGQNFLLHQLNKQCLSTYSILTFEIEIDTLISRIDVFANASTVVALSRIVSVAEAGSGGQVAELSRCRNLFFRSFQEPVEFSHSEIFCIFLAATLPRQHSILYVSCFQLIRQYVRSVASNRTINVTKGNVCVCMNYKPADTDVLCHLSLSLLPLRAQPT